MPDTPLNRVSPETMPSDLREAWSQSMDLRGDATFFEAFGNHPELFRWYVNEFYGRVFSGGLVERRYKELLRLKLSTLHGCRFCNQGNRADARAAGFSEVEIDAIAADPSSSVFQGADQAVLALGARLSMIDTGGRIDDASFAMLSEYFDDAQIIELGMVGAVLSGMAKFLFVFDLVEKEEDCPFQTAAHTQNS
jgi:AhpD family alkylhydroperoxidase